MNKIIIFFFSFISQVIFPIAMCDIVDKHRINTILGAQLCKFSIDFKNAKHLVSKHLLLCSNKNISKSVLINEFADYLNANLKCIGIEELGTYSQIKNTKGDEKNVNHLKKNIILIENIDKYLIKKNDNAEILNNCLEFLKKNKDIVVFCSDNFELLHEDFVNIFLKQNIIRIQIPTFEEKINIIHYLLLKHKIDIPNISDIIDMSKRTEGFSLDNIQDFIVMAKEIQEGNNQVEETNAHTIRKKQDLNKYDLNQESAKTFHEIVESCRKEYSILEEEQKDLELVKVKLRDYDAYIPKKLERIIINIKNKMHQLIPNHILLYGIDSDEILNKIDEISNEINYSKMPFNASIFNRENIDDFLKKIDNVINTGKNILIFIQNLDQFGKTLEEEERKFVLDTMINCLDRVKENKDIIVFSSAIDKENISSSILAKLKENYQIKITKPNFHARREIIKYYLSMKKINHTIEELDVLSNKFIGFNYLQIHECINIAAERLLLREEEYNSNKLISINNFEKSKTKKSKSLLIKKELFYECIKRIKESRRNQIFNNSTDTKLKINDKLKIVAGIGTFAAFGAYIKFNNSSKINDAVKEAKKCEDIMIKLYKFATS